MNLTVGEERGSERHEQKAGTVACGIVGVQVCMGTSAEKRTEQMFTAVSICCGETR